jgi:hypothetical protein
VSYEKIVQNLENFQNHMGRGRRRRREDEEVSQELEQGEGRDDEEVLVME